MNNGSLLLYINLNYHNSDEAEAGGSGNPMNRSNLSQSSNLTVEGDRQDLIDRVTGEQGGPAPQRRRQVEQQQSSDEEIEVIAPTSKKRKLTGRSKRSNPAGTTKAKDSNKDLWTTVGYIWPAHERPPGLLQDREWVNSQSYESISLMRKAGIFVIFYLYLSLFILFFFLYLIMQERIF